MGLFSGLKKAFKSIFKGIKKTFKSIIGAIGKFAGSDIGKIILTAAAIFTGGMALMGGAQGWAAASSQGAGFMGRFVAGAEGFMTALINPIEQAKSMMGGASTVGQATQLASQTGNTVAGQAAEGITQAATGTAETANIANAGQGTALNSGASISTAVAGPVTDPALNAASKVLETATKEPSWLERAAAIGKSIIDSPVAAQLLQGYAEGGAAEEQNKFTDRVRQSWMDPNNAFQKQLNSGGMLSGTVKRGASPVFNPGGPVKTSGAMPGEPLPIG